MIWYDIGTYIHAHDFSIQSQLFVLVNLRQRTTWKSVRHKPTLSATTPCNRWCAWNRSSIKPTVTVTLWVSNVVHFALQALSYCVLGFLRRLVIHSLERLLVDWLDTTNQQCARKPILQRSPHMSHSWSLAIVGGCNFRCCRFSFSWRVRLFAIDTRASRQVERHVVLSEARQSNSAYRMPYDFRFAFNKSL